MTMVQAIFFLMRTTLGVVDVLDRTLFAASSRHVEDVNYVEDGAQTKKMRLCCRL